MREVQDTALSVNALKEKLKEDQELAIEVAADVTIQVQHFYNEIINTGLLW